MTPTLTVVWSPRYEVDIGAHVFPTLKYGLVRDRVLERGVVTPGDFVEPEAATDECLQRVHTATYLRKIRNDAFSQAERRQLEVPFSAELANAMRVCCGGTLLTARRALQERVAVHLGGGFHHAFAAHGEGFCLLNDVAAAVATLLAEGSVASVAVVDLDVHHGNGTAAIFASDPRVFTFSMHQDNNYPAQKPPSDRDVPLDDYTPDGLYLELLAEHLPVALDESGAELVMYLAGADPYGEDQLGGLALTLEGLRTRDRMVYEACAVRSVPVAVTLAGGYALRTDDTVEIHTATVEEASRIRKRGSGG